MKKLYFCLSGLLLCSCSGTKPSDLGLQNNTLAECFDRSNCTSSTTKHSKNHIKPIPYTQDNFVVQVTDIINNLPRTKIIETQNNYIYFQQKSFLFRFVDDVELWYQKDQQLIQIRSASRVGKSDLGVNRKRLEDIRGKIEVTK